MANYLKLSKGPRILKNQFPKSGNELTQVLQVPGVDLETAQRGVRAWKDGGGLGVFIF